MVGKNNIEKAKKYLIDREYNIKKDLKVTLSNKKSVTAWCGNTSPDLKGKIAHEIAVLALESEKRACPGRGGVSYIKKSKEIGVSTPMMNDILKEISKI